MDSAAPLLSKFASRIRHYQLQLHCMKNSLNDAGISTFTLCSRTTKTGTCILNPGDSKAWTYSRYACFYGTLKHSVISDVMQSINVEKLQERSRRQALLTGTRVSVKDLVEKELALKFCETIENFSEQEKKALKVIQLEHSFLYSEGYAIPPPEKMTCKNWLEAMTLETMEARLYHYVSVEDSRVDQLKEKIEHRTPSSAERIHDADNKQSILYDAENPDLQIRWGNYRLASAMQHGIPLVIDMDYEDMSSSVDLGPLSQQLWDMYCANRSHPDPFHLIFTNCSESNPTYRHFAIHRMVETSFVLATFTEKSHLELFPRQDMVYLSAQTHNCLGEFSPNSVYILGAYHDPLVRRKGSFVRARQTKIRSSRLPIDENVRWRHQASKDLSMDQMVNILLSVKAKQPWKDAFISNVPMFVNQAS